MVCKAAREQEECGQGADEVSNSASAGVRASVSVRESGAGEVEGVKVESLRCAGAGVV